MYPASSAWATQRALHFAARALLFAYLPSLLFLGHWTPRLDLPGTDYYIGLPAVTEAHSHDASTSHDHDQHCHGSSASCASGSATAAAPVAVLAQDIAATANEDHGSLLALAAWEPAVTHAPSPDTPPPRVTTGV